MITQKGVAGTCKTQQSQAERQQRGRRKRRKLSFALKTNNPPNLNVFYFFFNENTSLYSDNPFCNYSFSILYYQEPKL